MGLKRYNTPDGILNLDENDVRLRRDRGQTVVEVGEQRIPTAQQYDQAVEGEVIDNGGKLKAAEQRIAELEAQIAESKKQEQPEATDAGNKARGTSNKGSEGK